jgi:hypothetical protein
MNNSRFNRITLGSTLLAVLVTVGAASSVAIAQNNPGPGPGACEGHGGHGGRGHGPMDPARFTQRFDTNGNGVVEVSELPPRMAERLGAADTNHDGAISADELRAHWEQRRAARQAGGGQR